MKAWSTKNPARAIHWMAVAIHGFSAVIVFTYTAIVRGGLDASFLPHQAQITMGARLYLVLALVIGSFCRRVSVRIWVLPFLATPNDLRLQKNLLLFPLWQSGISALCWFSSIPVIAAMHYFINGRLNPISFPHFCFAIFFGGLTATAYSASFFSLLVARLLRKSRVQNVARFMKAARLAPWVALLVPILTAVLFHLFDKPAELGELSYFHLGRFFTFLMILSGCAWVLCDRACKEARTLMKKF